MTDRYERIARQADIERVDGRIDDALEQVRGVIDTCSHMIDAQRHVLDALGERVRQLEHQRARDRADV